MNIYSELWFNGNRVSIWDDEKVLKVDGGDGPTTQTFLVPLSCTFKMAKIANFYVICILL